MSQSITVERKTNIERVLSLRQKDLTLVLANIHDPHNVSAIYRSADAFGVATIHLYYTDTKFPKLGEKTSASAKKWVDSIQYSEPEVLRSSLKEQKCTIIATSCSANARPLASYDFTKPTAIVMGNEHSGVPSELLHVVDSELYIPMYGMIQSFNVSVAAAIILAEASRQRFSIGMYNKPTYTQEEYNRKLLAWFDK